MTGLTACERPVNAVLSGKETRKIVGGRLDYLERAHDIMTASSPRGGRRWRRDDLYDRHR